ncbi:GNAT family N-acetyltransferase [Pseudarthrobacter psychrotolerans]|uniref:GNAT family N-acetyltransferase n=1 Tax=Pseudarthrobacter psychrotolerans TaxID=2697569 RepID=A0A6P1NM58_9MICC|nr:GNAT family N-acetyltransferase [Pseudarthrobacter psychrotolerans]QHK20123.1 GNAT family N-acetyltransferase [Pseudarthrobacter psychrotolerans]
MTDFSTVKPGETAAPLAMRDIQPGRLAGVQSSGGVLRVVDDAEWDAHIARLGSTDTYSCAAYHRASALLEPEGTRPILLAFGDEAGEVALPLLMRPLPDGEGWDATSAYGYGGPVGRGAPDLTAFGAALDEWAGEHGVVSTFLRLNPLLGNGRLVPPMAELVDVASTVRWDLSPGRDLRQGLHSDQRRSVRKAERAGLTITVTPRPADLEQVRDLYAATMLRQQAADFFYFPGTYWQSLLTDDPLLIPLLVEGRLEGRLVSALLCFVSDRWLHAHVSAGDDMARAIGASAACYLAAAEWGQAHALTDFHLGGGVGGSTTSPLYAFKQRFDPGSQPGRFQVAKFVHDRNRYRHLAGTDATDGFFPPWRRPQE